MPTRMLSASLAVALIAASFFHAAADAIDDSFFPYKGGFPSPEGYVPGVEITAENVASYERFLDPTLRTLVRENYLPVQTDATEDFALHPNYIEATRRYAPEVALGEAGEIRGYVAGRPFPESPDAQDPRSGEKLIWNYRFGFGFGDNALLDPNYWTLRNLKTGEVERRLSLFVRLIKFQQRVVHFPLPAFSASPQGVFHAGYNYFREPFDLKNTQTLIYQYADGRLRDDAWLYLGFQRRVRRLATGQVTDSYLGTDFMIEDFGGYNARVDEYKWAFKGEAVVLLPFFRHDELELASDLPPDKDGYQFIAFHGKSDCFPKFTYQLRKAYVVEGTPVEPSHPISRRELWLDAQTAMPTRVTNFDRSGSLWKVLILGRSHPNHHLPQNKRSGVPIEEGGTGVDLQAQHCTTVQFKTQIDPALVPAEEFTVQYMRTAGR